MNSLYRWLEAPRDDRGLRFLDDLGGWNFCTYETLASLSLRVGWGLVDAGVRPGGVVCIFLPTGPSLFAAIYGTWVAGGTVSPLVPPTMFQQESEYMAHVVRILQVASPVVVATDSEHMAMVERAVAQSEVSGTTVLDVSGIGNEATSFATPSDVALLQFTSGSSGAPRAVKVTFANLESNIESIRSWIGMGADDATATWLPLYHDMGLIGCLLTPAYNRSDVWIMRPEQFVREPIRWLECFGRMGASLCAAPNFGYGYAARRVDASRLQGFDFSNWRVAIAGAEPVDAQALTLLSDALSPFGFSNRAFLPAYGLAEATLAATGVAPDVVARALQLEWDSLAFGKPIKILAKGDLTSLDRDSSFGWLVGSGRPHPGVDIRILGRDGSEVPEGTLGEIFVGGPSVALGYRGDVLGRATRFASGGVISGDAGFIVDGELYVVGRIADSLKVRGRTVFADDLESRVVEGTEIRRGHCVVVASSRRVGGGVLVIGEGADKDWGSRASRIVRGVVGDSVPVKVLVGPRGLIRRTSSGKPRRRVMWELDQSGDLGGHQVA